MECASAELIVELASMVPLLLIYIHVLGILVRTVEGKVALVNVGRRPVGEWKSGLLSRYRGLPVLVLVDDSEDE